MTISRKYISDLSDYQSDREVTREDGENLAKQLNAVFIETSAKDNFCVTDLFQVCRNAQEIKFYMTSYDVSECCAPN